MSRGSLALIFGLALLLRIGFSLDHVYHHPQADRPVIDEASYEAWALEIAEGDWVGDGVFFQEPLYPYWLGSVYALWGVGDDEAEVTRRRRMAAKHIQALYGAVTAVLVALVAARLFGRTAGWTAGLALATYRPLLAFPSYLLKPNLVVPLLALLVWVGLAARLPARGPRGWLAWLGLGLLAGAGALLRGNLLLLLPVFVLLPVLRLGPALRRGEAPWSRALAPAGAVLAGIALLLLPVALRNQAVGGVFALTTSGAGTNVYGGNNAHNPYGRATEFPWVRGVPEHEAEDWRHEAERRSGRLLDPGEVSDFWLGATLDSIAESPGLHARILWNKLRLSLGAYEVPDNHHLAWNARFVSALALPIPGFDLWGTLGLAGLLAWASRRWLGAPAPDDARGARELAILFALYLGTIVLTVTSMRVRLALVPLLVPFAGYLVHLVARRSPPRAWLPALVLAAAVVHWPVLSAAEREDDLVKRDFNHAVGLLQADRLEDARGVVELLAESRPGTVPVALLEAELAYRRGARLRRERAPAAEIEARFDRALALLRPVAQGETVAPRDRFRARKLAGLVLFEAANWDGAERRFREALAFDPADPELRLLLANVLWIRAEDQTGEALRQGLAECRGLLEGLLEETPSSELAGRLAEVEAALAAGG